MLQAYHGVEKQGYQTKIYFVYNWKFILNILIKTEKTKRDTFTTMKNLLSLN